MVEIHKVLGQAMKKRPTGTSGERTLLCGAVAKIPGRQGAARTVLSRDRTEGDEKFVQHCQSIYVYIQPMVEVVYILFSLFSVIIGDAVIPCTVRTRK